MPSITVRPAMPNCLQFGKLYLQAGYKQAINQELARGLASQIGEPRQLPSEIQEGIDILDRQRIDVVAQFNPADNGYDVLDFKLVNKGDYTQLKPHERDHGLYFKAGDDSSGVTTPDLYRNGPQGETLRTLKPDTARQALHEALRTVLVQSMSYLVGEETFP